MYGAHIPKNNIDQVLRSSCNYVHPDSSWVHREPRNASWYGDILIPLWSIGAAREMRDCRRAILLRANLRVRPRRTFTFYYCARNPPPVHVYKGLCIRAVFPRWRAGSACHEKTSLQNRQVPSSSDWNFSSFSIHPLALLLHPQPFQWLLRSAIYQTDCVSQSHDCSTVDTSSFRSWDSKENQIRCSRRRTSNESPGKEERIINGRKRRENDEASSSMAR